MPLNCFGLHDWCEPFLDPFSKVEQYIIQCMSCMIIQRYYPQNLALVVDKGEVSFNQLHQQGWNVRPDKPFFDVPDSDKGYAG